MNQSLAGRLLHLAACVAQAKKIHWFKHYSSEANGKAIYTLDRPLYYIESDSSLQGGGALALSYCYTWTYSEHHKDTFKTIHQLEALNSMVAYKTFAHLFPHSNSHVVLHTDNEASAFALQSGRTKDLTLSACARELWQLAATHDHRAPSSTSQEETFPSPMP